MRQPAVAWCEVNSTYEAAGCSKPDEVSRIYSSRLKHCSQHVKVPLEYVSSKYHNQYLKYSFYSKIFY